MSLTRRNFSLAGAAVFGLAAAASGTPASAQTADAASLTGAVEALRTAMLAADKAALEALSMEQLSYGHSSGKLENKAQFVAAIADKKSIFKTIALSDHANTITGNTAIVRHIFAADVESGGTPSSVKIGILQVWQKQDGRWKLYARQAYKL